RQCQAPIRNLTGRLSLRMTAALLHSAALLVSLDSGPMHLSCAVGTPVVGLFGPTAPWRTGPFGSGHHIIRKDLSCSPCYRRRKCPKNHHRCMEDISVAEVFEVCCNCFATIEHMSFFERLGYGNQQGTA
ncbi:MAG: glycosyltransferase family 9 protein, partial [Desulfobacterota bacterium]|nr:glycosyltransferase family 9 protein [Thermodesulfobacteriota bacterium]